MVGIVETKQSQAIQEVFTKGNIVSFFVYWRSKPYGKPWSGSLKYVKDDTTIEKDFAADTAEELLKLVEDFSNKNLLLEIK